MDCGSPGSSVHGILQARTLEWIATPFSRGSSQSRDPACVPCTEGRLFTVWATREAPKDEWSLNFNELLTSMIIYVKIILLQMKSKIKGTKKDSEALHETECRRNCVWRNFGQVPEHGSGETCERWGPRGEDAQQQLWGAFPLTTEQSTDDQCSGYLNAPDCSRIWASGVMLPEKGTMKNRGSWQLF